MSDTTFVEALCAAVLQETPTAFPDRVRHRLEVQAQHDALDLASLLETRGPTLVELEYLLGLRQSPTRPARLLALLRQEHLTVLSAAHYQAIRTALAHNTFQEVEGTPWPTAVLATGPARGHAELRPLVADTTPWLSPDVVDAWAQRMWQQRAELSDLDADALDALSALWLYQARTPQDDAVADVDELLDMRDLQPKQRGHGRRSGYEPEQREAMLRALTHLQNLWLTMTALEVYTAPTPRARRRRETQAVQSRVFLLTDLLGQIHPDGWFEVEKFIFRPGKVFAHFLHGAGRQTALHKLRCRASNWATICGRWRNGGKRCGRAGTVCPCYRLAPQFLPRQRLLIFLVRVGLVRGQQVPHPGARGARFPGGVGHLVPHPLHQVPHSARAGGAGLRPAGSDRAPCTDWRWDRPRLSRVARW